jgi:hypothetical protein
MGGITFPFAGLARRRAMRMALLTAVGLSLAWAASDHDSPPALAASLSPRSAERAAAQVIGLEPIADIGGPYLIEEGSSDSLDATGSSDPDGTVDLYEWDLDDDGIFGETGAGAANGDETGPTPTFDAALLDGPLAHPIALRVTDNDANSVTVSDVIAVTNVAVADAGGPYNVAEGGNVTLAATSDDPAPADTQEHAWDFDGDGQYDDATGADAEFSAAGVDGPGSVTIKLQVTDDDGGVATATATVNIENAAPSVTVIGDTINEGEQATVTIGFTDGSAADTHTATVDWGDGSAVEGLGAVTSPVDAAHVYASPGIFTVTATVTDDDGGVGSSAASVQVATLTPDFTQTVNSTGDSVDLTLLDGICWTGDVNSEDDPECTLRAAIQQSNFTSGLNAIEFDIPESDSGYDSAAGAWVIQPAAALPAVIDSVSIDGYTQPGAAANTAGPGLGLDAVIKIELDGSLADIEAGLTLVASDNDIRGLAIGGFNGSQVLATGTSGDNVIQGAFIGTDASGMEARGDGHGIYIQSSGNLVGGSSPGERNLVSGNDGSGVVIAGSDAQSADGNVVSGNIIGLAADGSTPLGNAGAGVWLASNANGNLIGGFSAEEGNAISGNGGAGISIELSSSGNQVSANIIGADVTGTAAAGNADGIRLLRGDDNLIGGATAGAGNLISGNTGTGIWLVSEFVLPESGRPENTVIQGNLIGTDITGASPLGNGSHGVLVGNAPGTLIGGTGAGEANTIAFNGGDGVRVEYPLAGIAVLSDSIHSNGGLGIDLDGDGVTPNDEGDGDTGPNDLQNFPVIEQAIVSEDSLTVSGHLDTQPGSEYRIELFLNEECDPGTGHGEGALFLGSILVTPGGDGLGLFSETFAISLPKGIFVTATATRPDGSTSEFSQCAVTTGAPPVADAGGPYAVNEGGSTTLDGSGSTDADSEIVLYAWDFDGDGVTDAVGESPLFDATLLDGPDTVTVTLTVTDDEGLQSAATAEVSVGNVNPSVSVTGDAIDEGQSATVSIQFADGGAADTHSVVIDWGDGSAPQDAGIVPSPLDRSHLYSDDGDFTVTVTVTDDDGGVGKGFATVEVAPVNDPPVADAGGPYAVIEGQSVTLDGSGSVDTDGLIVLFEWDLDGDSVTDATGESVTFDALALSGPQTIDVRLTVTDNGGLKASDTASVSVMEAADLELHELWTKVGSGDDDAFHTPGGWPGYSDKETVVFAGAPGGNGPTYGGFRWDGLDIPEGSVILEVYVELMQKNWGYEFETTLSLEDSPDGVSFSHANSPYARWSDDRTEFELRWTADLGVPGTWISTPDLSAGVQELVNRYGGIESLVLLESGEGVPDGKYHEWRAYNINPNTAARLHIRYMAPNTPPAVDAGPDRGGVEGGKVHVSDAKFVDGSEGDFTATIDWGDGTVDAGNVSQAAQVVSGAHYYADDGIYTVTISVTDADGLTGTDAFIVTVTNAAPVVDAGPAQSAETGDAVSLPPAWFTDAGIHDTHTATIDWGDGVAEAGTVGESAGSGSVAGSHSYGEAGLFTVKVCVTDDGGGTGCGSFDVQVNEAPEPGVVLAQVAAGSDDAYESPAGWPNFSATDVVVYAGAPNGSGATYGGWRWDGLGIPAGAIITGAYVELKQAQWGYAVTTTLSLEDGAAPATFTPGSTPADRWAGRTGFEQAWAWPKATPGTWISTPDLAAGVQELVDTYGGIDSLALLESGEGVANTEYHEWSSFESGADNAARLRITWRLPEPKTPEWSGTGQVLFVGPSPDPTAPTLTTGRFFYNDDDSINNVEINTVNEFVAGALFGGIGGGALAGCRDAEGGASCARLNELLTGAAVSSLHISAATLTVLDESVIQVPLETPGGTVVLDIPVISGALTGQLAGLFIISQGADTAAGFVNMQINPGSSGTYACFELTLAGPVPLTSLDSCIDQTGGQLYPIILDVHDSGTFAVGQGTGVLAEIVSISGSVEVAAQSNLLTATFGGTITITDAVAQLGGGPVALAFGAPAEGLVNAQPGATTFAARRRENEA